MQVLGLGIFFFIEFQVTLLSYFLNLFCKGKKALRSVFVCHHSNSRFFFGSDEYFSQLLVWFYILLCLVDIHVQYLDVTIHYFTFGVNFTVY